MKTLFSKRNVLVFLAFFLSIGFLYYVFIDGLFVQNFRSSDGTINRSESVDLTGLNELHASGGPMIHYTALKEKLTHVQGDKIVVDGIGGQTGFVKGFPSTYFSYQIVDPEWRAYIRRLIFTGTTKVRHDLLIPEEEEAKKYGFQFMRIKIGSKFATSPDSVNEFVSFVDGIPQKSWVHFHCRGGKGRTSMMLVMYDIMKNAPHVALADIVKRQHLLGSVDLFDTESWARGTYRIETLQERKKFIEDFYSFICQRKAGGIQSWSEWLKQHKLAPSVTSMLEDTPYAPNLAIISTALLM